MAGVDMHTADKPQTLRLTRAVPVIFVADVETSGQFFKTTLGFSIDFIHGEPPFYGSVSRDGATIHLKFVHEPVLVVGPEDRDGFINAFIEVDNAKALYAEFNAAGATFDQELTDQVWGKRDFIVRDPDGNGICFVGPIDNGAPLT
jgi:catechol 2,3-dioxygenase-like lactoylglutathione lyase family enzyme